MPIEFVRVTWPGTDRTVNIDGTGAGQTNTTLRVERGTHDFDLDLPLDYTPASRRRQVIGTGLPDPMVIAFDFAPVGAAPPAMATMAAAPAGAGAPRRKARRAAPKKARKKAARPKAPKRKAKGTTARRGSTRGKAAPARKAKRNQPRRKGAARAKTRSRQR